MIKKISRIILAAGLLTATSAQAGVLFELNSKEAFDQCGNKTADGTNGHWEWYSYVNGARIFVYGTTAYDDYLVTPELNLTAGNLYSISFKTSSAEYNANGTAASPYGEMFVAYGPADGAYADYTELDHYTNLPYTTDLEDMLPKEIFFGVEETGAYRIAFHALTKIHVAELVISEASPTTPAPVADLNIEPEGTTNKVNITFTVPSTNPAGLALDATTLTVKVSRGETSIHEAAYAPGTSVSISDENAPDGRQTYSVVVCNGQEVSEAATATCWVGEVPLPEGTVNLPFADSFAGAKISDAWTIEYDGYYKWEAAASTYSPSATPQDEDGGLILFNCYNASRNTTSTLITPPLNTRSAKNAELRFYVYGPGNSSATLDVLISKDGEAWENIDSYVLSELESGWNEMAYALTERIAGSNTFRIAFKGTSDYGNYRMVMDNISISNSVGNDLGVTNLSGPATVVAGNDAEYSFTIQNAGANAVAASDYTLSVDCNGTEIDGILPVAIQPKESASFTFTVPFTVQEAGVTPVTFTVNIEFEADEIADNNSASMQTTVVSSSKPTVTDVNAVLENGEVTVTWTPVIDATNYTPVDIHESFEDFSQGDKGPFNGFIIYDFDQETASSWYGETSTEFTVSGNGNGFANTPKATDGQQRLIVIGAGGNNQDDWIVSPLLNCSDITTMTYEIDIYFRGEEVSAFEVLYSTTDNSYSSFINVIVQVSRTAYQNSGAWETFKWTGIPAEAKYIALRFTDHHGLLVDNIKIYDNAEAPIGYHIYDEIYGRMNAEMLEPTVDNYTFPLIETYNSEAETRYFTVTAVYADGESAKSEQASISVETGVEAVAGADMEVYGGEGMLSILNASAGTAVYTIDGRLVARCNAGDIRLALPRGIYIVKGARTVKTMVR